MIDTDIEAEADKKIDTKNDNAHEALEIANTMIKSPIKEGSNHHIQNWRADKQSLEKVESSNKGHKNKQKLCALKIWV